MATFTLTRILQHKIDPWKYYMHNKNKDTPVPLPKQLATEVRQHSFLA